MSRTKLSREEITTKVIAMVKEIVGGDLDITPKTDLMSELDIDSLTMVRLDILIQSNIGLAISADDLEGIKTIEDLVSKLITHGQPVQNDE